MNSYVSLTSIGKIVGQTELFNLGVASGQGEGKLWIIVIIPVWLALMYITNFSKFWKIHKKIMLYVIHIEFLESVAAKFNICSAFYALRIDYK